jgi:hypothetical protein
LWELGVDVRIMLNQIKEKGYESVSCIEQVQDRTQLCDFVNTATKFQVPYKMDSLLNIYVAANF